MSSDNKELKKEIEEYEAIEKFMLDCNDRNERLKAHYREGTIINGKWVNNVETDEEDEPLEDVNIEEIK